MTAFSGTRLEEIRFFRNFFAVTAQKVDRDLSDGNDDIVMSPPDTGKKRCEPAGKRFVGGFLSGESIEFNMFDPQLESAAAADLFGKFRDELEIRGKIDCERIKDQHPFFQGIRVFRSEN